MLTGVQKRLVTILCMLFSVTGSAATVTCHLHTPTDIPADADTPAIISDVGSVSDCENLNFKRFASRGRCHCTLDGIGSKPLFPATSRPAPGMPPDWMQ